MIKAGHQTTNLGVRGSNPFGRAKTKIDSKTYLESTYSSYRVQIRVRWVSAKTRRQVWVPAIGEAKFGPAFGLGNRWGRPSGFCHVLNVQIRLTFQGPPALAVPPCIVT